MMNKLDLSLHYLDAVVINDYNTSNKNNKQQISLFIQELYTLGYVPTKRFVAELNYVDIKFLFELCLGQSSIKILKEVTLWQICKRKPLVNY